jgi:hypothetical protein
MPFGLLFSKLSTPRGHTDEQTPQPTLEGVT